MLNLFQHLFRAGLVARFILSPRIVLAEACRNRTYLLRLCQSTLVLKTRRATRPQPPPFVSVQESINLPPRLRREPSASPAVSTSVSSVPNRSVPNRSVEPLSRTTRNSTKVLLMVRQAHHPERSRRSVGACPAVWRDVFVAGVTKFSCLLPPGSLLVFWLI